MNQNSWRAFYTEHKERKCEGFIDGDLIESFLDLKREKKEEIALQLKISVEDLSKRIEDLGQSIH